MTGETLQIVQVRQFQRILSIKVGIQNFRTNIIEYNGVFLTRARLAVNFSK